MAGIEHQKTSVIYTGEYSLQRPIWKIDRNSFTKAAGKLSPAPADLSGAPSFIP